MTVACRRCDDTGVIETGNNDLPCDCPAGDKAQFNIAMVDGLVTGAEVKRHFHNGSPEPLRTPVTAEDLPGRKMARALMGVVERRSDIDLRATNALLDAVEKDSERVGVIRYLPAPPEGHNLVVTDGEQWTVLGVVMTPGGPRIKVRIEQLSPPAALTPKEDK